MRKPASPKVATFVAPRAPRALLAPLALLALSLGAACSNEPDYSYDFGPFTVASGDEMMSDCVQISLNNTEPVYVSSVELTTGPGFHHSNWLWVPEHIFAGEDGTFKCRDRGYSEAVAAVFGGVLFAQSTQVPHEVQAFPPGIAVKLPPKTKLIAQIHLLNPTDAPLKLRPNITLAMLPEAEVQTKLAGISFQNQGLYLPPNRASRFSVECDLAERHQALLGSDPDFRIYYGLAHYHELGTRLDLEAVRPDGTASMVYSTAALAGDTLGGPITPAFDMTGYTKLRFSCDFYNPRAEVVEWGIGDQEMCVFLAFTDSEYNWGGGVNEPTPPQTETEVGNAIHYTSTCAVFATDARH
ncbi:MAG TPA: hypothetical protein VNO30_08480 [Kofleriaceae bacterium]|nr:hypothetical protein [Kofleriaceae bacterium]